MSADLDDQTAVTPVRIDEILRGTIGGRVYRAWPRSFAWSGWALAAGRRVPMVWQALHRGVGGISWLVWCVINNSRSEGGAVWLRRRKPPG